MRRDRADILRNSNSGFGFTLQYEKGKSSYILEILNFISVVENMKDFNLI